MIDCKKLEKRLDEALENETKESLSAFLDKIRKEEEKDFEIHYKDKRQFTFKEIVEKYS